MNQDYIISVITPFYRGNKYIEQLFCVINKNYQKLRETFSNAKIELIIVNDSPEVEIEQPTTKVEFEYKVIKHKKNSGIHQARVTGLSYCTGDYVLFLDQDDVLKDNAIVSQMRTIIKNKADLVICNAYMEKADGSFYALYSKKTDFNRINDKQFYLKSHNVIKSPGQCLIKTSCIPEEWTQYIMRTNGSDDLFLWILLFEKSYQFVINNEILYTHKYTGENLSESEEKMGTSSLEIVDFLEQIDYVRKSDIKNLKKSRQFRLELSHSSLDKKIKLILKNFDLMCYLIINKLKYILF